MYLLITKVGLNYKITDDEKQLAIAYAKLQGMSLSEAIKKTYFDKIEEEYDVVAFDEALKEYKNNPKTYSLSEAKEEIVFKIQNSLAIEKMFTNN